MAKTYRYDETGSAILFDGGSIAVDPTNGAYQELMRQVAEEGLVIHPHVATTSWSDVRARRDALLVASDRTQLVDAPYSEAKRAEWAAYREALRDLPQTYPNPSDVVWPVAPSAEE